MTIQSPIREWKWLVMCLFFMNYAGLISAQGQTINLALNKPAVASTLETSAYPASNATDGNETTKWSSGGNFAQWLYVDLGSFYDVQKVVLKWADDRYASTLDIQVSNDAVQWSTIFTINPNPASGNPVTTITGITGIGRYVRFNGRGRGTGVRYRVAEFEVYGVLPAPPTPEQQAAIDDITTRLINKLIPESVNDANVDNLAGTMLADGSWNDIDYDDKSETSWKPGAHLNRLVAMAVAYRTPSSSSYDSETLRDKIVLGIDYYYTKSPTSNNWWYNDIGGPQDYMIPLILLKGKIDRTLLLKYSAYLAEQTVRFAGGGKNLTWVAEISIYKGCIEDDFRTTDIAFKAMASTLVIVPNQGDEGIKIDNSFHQHHEQLYSGGYGMSIISDLSDYIELTGGNLFAASFSTAKRKILSDLLLDGHRLLGYRNVIDFGTLGRNISRPASGPTNISASVLEKMIVGDPDRAPAYQSWKDHLSGAPFPAVGNKHFWKSDIMTQHGGNYYLSAKVISKRTLGTEALNGENVKAFNLPLGATNILTHGSEYDNIFPVWDWARVPGTTAEQSQYATALEGYIYGTNDFGGGVSNGKNGAIAYEHNYNGVMAKKAYFFMGDAMLCLGSGISANKTNPVATSVNQSFLSGDITVSDGNSTEILQGNSQNFTNLAWVHHDNVGYIIPAGGDITVQDIAQSGSWRSINGDGSTAVITRNVFSMWVNHGNTPENQRYQYIVAPDRSLTDFQNYAGDHGFVVMQNTSEVQAIRNDKTGSYAVVFYIPGTVEMGDGTSISSDKKAIVFIQRIDSEYQVSVSDPLYNQTNVNITITKAPAVGNGRVSAESVTVAVTFPVGDYRGSTFTSIVPLSALPVVLTEFSAKTEGKMARLFWETTSESNSSHFIVEKSRDVKSFNELGKVNAANSSSVGIRYSFTDNSPLPGLNYYRLKMVDLDGSYAFSRIVALDFGGLTKGLIIFPNPVQTQLKMALSGMNGPVRVSVFNSSGLLLIEKTITDIDEGQIDIRKIPAGIYILKVTDGKVSFREKFMKQ